MGGFCEGIERPNEPTESDRDKELRVIRKDELPSNSSSRGRLIFVLWPDPV